MNRHLIFIDNFDSFTYNLVDELAQLDFSLDVLRNTVSVDAVLSLIDEKSAQGPVAVCFSPGPGHPKQAGNMMELITALHQRAERHNQAPVPMLGICLGFQALIEFYGGKVDRCYETMHGKTSAIEISSQFQDHPVFAGLSNPLPVARYHSLMATTLPANCDTLASFPELKGERTIPMAIAHKNNPVVGFQFHPESIMTIQGRRLLENTMQFLFSAKEQENAPK